MRLAFFSRGTKRIATAYLWYVVTFVLYWLMQANLTYPLTSLLHAWGLRRFARGPNELALGPGFGDSVCTLIAVFLACATLLFVTLFPFQLLFTGLVLRTVARIRVHCARIALRACASRANCPMLVLTPLGLMMFDIGYWVVGCTFLLLGTLAPAAWFTRCTMRRRAGRVYHYRCKRCGYSLRGLPSARPCPECGASRSKVASPP